MRLVSKKQQVERFLRKEIQRGRWALGEQMPSEDSLLEDIGVSRSTIREALNSLSAEGIIVRKHGTGTFVDRIPVRSIVVCAWFENLTSPMGFYYRELVNAMRKLVRQADYQFDVIVGNGENMDSAMRSVCRFVNGPVLSDFYGAINLLPNADIDSQFRNLGVPVVNIQTGVPSGKYSVVLDYKQMASMVVELMRAYGSSDFTVMYIADPVEKLGEPLYDYLNGVIRSIVGNDSSRMLPTPTIEDAYDVFVQWWKSNHTDAIFFMDDSIYETASKAMLELKIEVPNELRVVTHCNVGRQFHIPVPVERVCFSPEETATAAWKMLHSLIEEKPVDEQIYYVPARIVSATDGEVEIS